MTSTSPDQTLLSLPEAADRLPGHPHVNTVFRWATRGIRLETVLWGGRRFVSVESLCRFAEQLTAISAGHPPSMHTAKRRERDVAQAERDLAKEGF